MRTLYFIDLKEKGTRLMRAKSQEKAHKYWKQFHKDLKVEDVKISTLNI